MTNECDHLSRNANADHATAVSSVRLCPGAFLLPSYIPKKTTSADEKATLTGYDSSSNSAQSMVLVSLPFFS